jgi:transcription termination factor Rho
MKDNKEYKNFLKESLNLQKIRDDRSKEVNQQALYKFAEKCIRTTMIGSLDAIEKNFGFLWNFDSQEEMTEEQKILKNIYEEARAFILDKGNNQIRFLKNEFADYEITRKKYHINLPVADSNNSKEGEKNDG